MENKRHLQIYSLLLIIASMLVGINADQAFNLPESPLFLLSGMAILISITLIMGKRHSKILKNIK